MYVDAYETSSLGSQFKQHDALSGHVYHRSAPFIPKKNYVLLNVYEILSQSSLASLCSERRTQ